MATAAILLAGASALGNPGAAAAHPLGNFTINQHSEIEVADSAIILRYALDMAEIPAFQEMAKIDTDQDGRASETEQQLYIAVKARELLPRLQLTSGGTPIALQVVESKLQFPPGQGGLATLRLDLLLSGPLPRHGLSDRYHLQYQNENYPNRAGWREIVVKTSGRVELLHATAPSVDRSQGLRQYPQDMLNSPPDQRKAEFSFRLLGADAAAGKAQQEVAAVPPNLRQQDRLAALLAARQLNLSVVVIALTLAVGLGMLHALSPGHGKGVMAAYLVGARGTSVHAVILGLIVTISHTFGVLALGLLVLFGGRVISPERLYPWLELLSGGVVIAVGLWILGKRIWRERTAEAAQICYGEAPFPGAHENGARAERSHQNGHAHHHGHSHHRHQPLEDALTPTWKNLFALGIAGGLVPSASALIIFLASLTARRMELGVALILAFSAGMAVTLAGIGLLIVHASRLIERSSSNVGLFSVAYRLLPVATPLLLLAFGSLAVARAMAQL